MNEIDARVFAGFRRAGKSSPQDRFLDGFCQEKVGAERTIYYRGEKITLKIISKGETHETEN